MKKPKSWYILAILLSGMYLLIGLPLSFNNATYYILSRRLVRIISVYLISYLTSVSTYYFQVATDNPILTPSILGIDSIYILIQVVLNIFLGIWLPTSLNFVLSCLVMVVVSTSILNFLLRILNNDLVRMLLIGMMISGLVQGLISTLQLIMDPNEYAVFQSLSLASLNDINPQTLFYSLPIFFIIYLLKNKLDESVDVASLGLDFASNLGLNIVEYRKKALFLVTACVALSTALMGPSLFIGLIAITLSKHMINQFSGQGVMRTATSISIVLLLASQLLFERILNFNGSIGILTTAVGGCVFIIIILKEFHNDNR